jgi:hypothetical protein
MPWPKILHRIDLNGKRFGRWVVIGFAGRKNRKGGSSARWRVQCDCGNVGVVPSDVLRDGRSRSCGCLNKELARQRIKHGHDRRGQRSLEYKVWVGIRSRCNNKAHGLYSYYGGRGIKVCSRWNGKNGFANFLKDMGPRPSARYSIERKDNNKGYSPSNCCWATHHDQMRNTRHTVMVLFGGRRMCLTDAAIEAGLPYKVVHGRIKRRGWTVERALTTPHKTDLRLAKWRLLLIAARKALSSSHASLIVEIEHALGWW